MFKTKIKFDSINKNLLMSLALKGYLGIENKFI